MLFYPNTVNRNADWSRPETLKVANPYDAVDSWRAGTRPGEASHSVRRLFGRLLDDAWHTALFTRPMPDFPPAMLRQLMEHVAAHRDGRLSGIESDFYVRMTTFHRKNRPMPRIVVRGTSHQQPGGSRALIAR